MTDFFNQIGQAFTLAVDFIAGLLSNMLMIMKLIGKSVIVVFNVIYYMPVVIQVILIALISYIIIINVTQKGG